VINPVLRYDKGTIVITGLGHIPFAVADPRTGSLRAPALEYGNIIEYLKRSGIKYTDNVLDLIPSPHIELKADGTNSFSFRKYQDIAFRSWIESGMKGCIVLPTGAGKTVIAIKAIEKINSACLIVVPTLDLMDQWVSVLSKFFANIEIGTIGGGDDRVEPITISTYDSAYIRSSSLGNRFSLIIFDEVHHLAAPGYRSIAEQMACRFRLGLTATFEREDGMHKELPRLVGGVVFQMSTSQLVEDKHLAQYHIDRRQVQMLPEEIEEYRKNFQKYQVFLKRLGFPYPIPLEKLIMMSGRNKLAREALLSRNKAMNIALNSKAKLEELKEILAENKGRKTIIFTQHNNLVYQISDRFLIPFITYKTQKIERHEVLKGFKENRYNAIVTSKVLDEGVDVPDAELGIILSGTGSAREIIQRLGRLLRPKSGPDKSASLIEITSAETREVNTSLKRKRVLAKETN
jgi:superfamily II DNA or RNA helicase